LTVVIDKQIDYAGGDAYTSQDYTSPCFGETILRIGWSPICGKCRGFGRFTGISGLSGVIITAAWIELNMCGNFMGSPHYKVSAQDAESPPQINHYHEHREAPRTSAFVDWHLEPGSLGWRKSPSLIPVIQELADKYNPSAITVLIDPEFTDVENTADWFAYEYGGHNRGMKLHIEYEPASDRLVESLNDTTYEITLSDGDKVEIGDKNASVFKPHLKLNRWLGECALDLDLAVTKDALPDIHTDKIVWDNGEIACEFLPEALDGQAELGGFKFNIIFKEKPQTNVSTLNFKAKGLDFYYQPDLTPEETAEGCIRPENVIGSYAVYHSARSNVHQTQEEAKKYKCGKAFHWYRPLIWDSSTPRKEVWGELHVDPEAGIRTVTIPQDFLDKAIYPVIVDDTFGYTTKGGTEADFFGNYIYGCLYTGAAGTGTSITCWLKQHLSYLPKLKYALYDAEDDFVTNGGTAEWTLTEGWDGEKELAFGTGPTLTAQNYHVCIWADAQVKYYWDEGDTDQLQTEAETYNGWPASAGWTSGWNRKATIYCTYTPTGGTTHYGVATLAGAGTLAGIGRLLLTGKATLSGAGNLSAIGYILGEAVYGAATLAGTGALSVIGGLLHTAKATISGTGALATAASLTLLGKATLAGVGSISAIAYMIRAAKVTLTGVGTLSVKGSGGAVGRVLKVAVITRSHRSVSVITSQYRKIKTITGG